MTAQAEIKSTNNTRCLLGIRCLWVLSLLSLALTIYSMHVKAASFIYDDLGRIQEITTPAKQILYDYDNANNRRSVAVFSAGVDVAVALNVSPTGSQFFGNHLYYRVDVSNLGALASSPLAVTFSVQSLGDITVASAVGWTCTGAELVTCSRSTLLAGSSSAITFDVLPDGPGVIVSTAVLEQGTTDEQPANDTASVATVVMTMNSSDSDGDGLPDAWERLSFGDLSHDGSLDSDLDGRSDRVEFADRTMANVPDFRMRTVAGLNLLSWPLAPVPAMTSADFLSSLGGLVESIERIDRATQALARTSWNGSNVSGEIFPITAGEGYMLRLARAYDGAYVGLNTSPAADLTAGVNMLGFTTLRVNYSAFQLLEALGGESVVASVGDFDPTSGRFRSAAYAEGIPAGVDFPIVQQRAYIVHLKQAVVGFRP